MTIIKELEFQSPYVGYTYSYPHKTAYRAFDPPMDLRTIWECEDRQSVFLYFHIPFCEYRCGFCNLFTHALPGSGLVDQYLDQLELQARTLKSMLPDVKFARLAIGGGTPTFLDVRQLERLLDIVRTEMQVDPRAIPFSCEASPATVDADKLRLLKDAGVDRLSFGVQSMIDQESKSLGRPQTEAQVESALDEVFKLDFPIVNLDLIYGGHGQDTASWEYSLRRVTSYQPAEIFLYPLYVREQTGLEKLSQRQKQTENEMDSSSRSVSNDQRFDLYEQGRDFLAGNGYTRNSMRMFRRESASVADGPAYCCQSDAMIGIGCGARSYTSSIHHSTQWAVSRAGVLNLIKDYNERDAHNFRTAWHGFRLDENEKRLRFVLMSLLQIDGLSIPDYVREFGSQPTDDVPQIKQLIDEEFAILTDEKILPTDRGLDWSDAIGPWLYSDKVSELMSGHVCH